MATITNTIRWADNTAELKKNLLEGIGTVDAMKTAVDRTVQSLSGGGLFAAANRVTAAIIEMGGATKMTAAEQAKANATIERAIEKYDAMGVAAPQALRDVANATRDVQKINEAAWQKSIDGINAFSSTAKTAGFALTAGLTAPLVALGGTALKASIDFESAFAGVRKTVSGTPEELQKLNDQFREMARVTPTSAVELAKIGEMAGQLGVKKDSITAFTKTIVDISVATNLTADEAGSSFARLANVLKMPQDQFSNLGSAVVALGNFGASTEQEMLNMGQRISAAGATANMTAPQILGIANALSSVGIEAEAGGSAVSKVINQIGSDVHSGGGKLETFAKISGMSAKQFQQAWRDDAGKAFATFMQGLANAREKGGDELLTLVDDLGFKEVRLKNAFMAAANAGTLMADSIELGTKAFKENTELTRAAEERYKTTANQLNILWNQLTDVAITIGDALIPVLIDAVKAAKPLVDMAAEGAKSFKDLDPAIKLVVVGVAGFAAALGPLLLVLGSVGSAISGTMLLMAQFPAIGTAASAVVGTLTTGMIGMAATAAGVLALAAAVGTATYALTRLIDTMSGGKLSGWLTPFLSGTEQLALETQTVAANTDTMRAATERSGHAVTSLSEAIRINNEWDKQRIANLQAGTAAQNAFVGPVLASAGATKTMADRLRELTAEQKADIDSKRALHESIATISKETGVAKEVVSMYIASTKDGSKATKQWADTMREYNSVAEDTASTVAAMDGATVEGIKYDLLRGQSQKVLQEVYGVTAEQIKAIVAEMKNEKAAIDATMESIKNFRAVGAAGAAAVGKGMFGGGQNVLQQLGEQMGTLQRKQLAPKSTIDQSNIIGLMPDLSGAAKTKMAKLTKGVGETMKDNVYTSLSANGGLTGTFARALEGGGGAKAAVQSFATTALSGVLSAIPMIGPILGQFAGPLISGFKKIFGGASEEEKKGRADVAAFEKQIASTLTTTQKAEAGGKQWAMTTIAVRDAFLATGRTAAEAELVTKQLWDTKNPEAYKGAIDQINAAMNEQAADQKRAKELIDEYGISIEQLGPKFKQQQLDEQAKTLMNDYRLMVDVLGVEAPAAMELMADKMNAFVQSAISSGAEVPASMRPMLEKMADMGLLTDSSGNAITDLGDAGIKFAETMTESTDRIIAKFDELIARMFGAKDAADSARDAAAKVPPHVTTTITTVHEDVYTSRKEESEYAARGGFVSNHGVLYFPGGGFVPHGTDTVPAMLTPGEGVLSRGDMAALGGPGGFRALRHGLHAGGGGGESNAAALSALLQSQQRTEKYLRLDFKNDLARAVRDEVQKVA